MSKQIKTIQSEDKNYFDELVNNYLKDGWELVENSYSIIDDKTYSQVVVRDEDNYRNIEYFDNGEIKCKGQYVDKLKEGEWISYYDDGQIEWIENYNKGIMTGERLHYKNDGSLCCKQEIINGDRSKKVGYHKNGEISMVSDYKSGEITTYYESGKIESTGKFLDDEPVGCFTYYRDDEDNRKELVEEYKDGKLVDKREISGKMGELFEDWKRSQ